MKSLPALLCLGLFLLPAAAQTQSEMNAEAAAGFEKADAVLNTTYQKVKTSLDAEGVEKLKASQRAWLAWRDAEAGLQADSARGGSMAPLLYNETRAELTEARAAQLKKLLDIYEDR